MSVYKPRVRHAVDYVEAVINHDVSEIDDIQKKPTRVRALMYSLSRNISTIATIKTLYNDIAQGDVGDRLSAKFSALEVMSLGPKKPVKQLFYRFFSCF